MLVPRIRIQHTTGMSADTSGTLELEKKQMTPELSDALISLIHMFEGFLGLIIIFAIIIFIRVNLS